MADPNEPSSDFLFMQAFWAMVKSILSGAPAMRAYQGTSPLVAGPQAPVANLYQLDRSGRTTPQSPYLPKFQNETPEDYHVRLMHAPFTNIFADISRNLSAKPFSKKLELDEATAEPLKVLSKDIDGQGHDLHLFGRDVFKAAQDNGITWIMVDYTKVTEGATLADERGMGARPYWVHITADRLKAVYSDFVNGKEIITNARIDECYVRRVGYGEETVQRIRELNREAIMDENGQVIGYGLATWALYEEVTVTDTKGKTEQKWQLIDQGLITLGYIPLVPITFGKRDGTSWRIDPPLKDLAYLQVEEFQQESNLKAIKEMTAFPMLAGNGVMPQDAAGGAIVVPVGPRAVLFAPPNADGRSNGEWKFIEPGASSLTFLAADIEKLRTEMRDLGMQPLATANLTVITTANVAMKAHSAVQAWALVFKDGLEQAWKITCDWLNRSDEPEVDVHTDFGVDLTAQTELDSLLKAEGQGILSKRTIQEEFKRRGVLSDDFDLDEEEQQLAEEQQGQTLTPEKMIDPVTGMPIVVQPEHGVLNPPPDQQGKVVPIRRNAKNSVGNFKRGLRG